MPTQQPRPGDTRPITDMTLQQGIVLTVMHRSAGVPQSAMDLRRAIGIDVDAALRLMSSLEASGYVGSWSEGGTVGVAENRAPRRYFLLTQAGVSAVGEAVRKFGRRLGCLDGLPVADGER